MNNYPNKQQTKSDKANHTVKNNLALSTPEESQDSAYVIAAVIDGAAMTLVLDSGAAILVIPEELVADEDWGRSL